MKIRTGFVSNSSSSSFAILGFVITDEVREKVKKLANAEETIKQTQKYWGCSKCDFESPMYIKKPEFCEKCGGKMHEASRVLELEWCDSELFEAIGMSYYSESDWGDVAGFDVDGKTAEEIIEIHKKLVTKLGEATYKVMIGEYAC